MGETQSSVAARQQFPRNNHTKIKFQKVLIFFFFPGSLSVNMFNMTHVVYLSKHLTVLTEH